MPELFLRLYANAKPLSGHGNIKSVVGRYFAKGREKTGFNRAICSA